LAQKGAKCKSFWDEEIRSYITLNHDCLILKELNN